MNEKQWDGLWSKASMIREKSQYYCHDCDVAFWVAVLRLSIPIKKKKRYVSFHINGYYDCNYKRCLPT